MNQPSPNHLLRIFITGYLIASLLVPTAWAQTADLSNRQKQNVLKKQKSFEEDNSKDQDTGGQDAFDSGIDPERTKIFYSVHVTGFVAKPGVYKVIPSDKVTDALKYAGGLLENGSKRRIQLRRESDSETLDIYLYENSGDTSQNPFLMENDVIFVPAKLGEIRVEGPVNRPGVYEIGKSVSLASAIQMAGGFTTGRSLKDPIRVVRYDDNEQKEVIEVENSASSLKAFKLVKGDIVVVPHLLLTDKKFDYNPNRIPGDNIFYPTMDNNVYVIGAVVTPGPYTFQPNFSYREYVNMAGPTRNIGKHSIKVFRRDGKKIRVSQNTIIQPGDTLIVPESKFKTEVLIGIAASVVSLALSSVILVDQLKNQ